MRYMIYNGHQNCTCVAVPHQLFYSTDLRICFHPVFDVFSSCICCISILCLLYFHPVFAVFARRRWGSTSSPGFILPTGDYVSIPGLYYTYHTIQSRVNKSLSLAAPDKQPLHAMRLWGFRCHAKMMSRWRHDQRSMPVAQIQLAYLRGFCFRSTKTTLSLSILVGM